ncbi:MAG: hypothetical protein IH608_05165 [Proteobacteria bacterium]|nr:hypothetical protein [Pseudomonadota bacterium]
MSLCALCASTGKTCCQQSDILITGGDLRRVRTHLGRSDFYEHRPPRDPRNLGDEGDPNWLAYTLLPEGTRRVLRQTAAGDCLFLSPAGCLLPAEVRPLICRLHPVTYTEAGITGVSPECPSHLAEPGLGTLQAIGMDLRAARRWHEQLYQELRQDFRPVDRAA